MSRTAVQDLCGALSNTAPTRCVLRATTNPSRSPEPAPVEDGDECDPELHETVAKHSTSAASRLHDRREPVDMSPAPTCTPETVAPVRAGALGSTDGSNRRAGTGWRPLDRFFVRARDPYQLLGGTFQ